MSKTNSEFTTFIKIADPAWIQAIRQHCRARFPKTVEVLDALNNTELKTVNISGLSSLPKEKLSSIEKAMKADKFRFLAA